MIKYVSLVGFVVYFLVIIILSFNTKKENKVIKYSGIVLFVLLALLFAFYNEKVIDRVIASVIRYFYFPSFTSYILTIFVSFIILVMSLICDKIDKRCRIINYIFSILIIVSYITFNLLEVDISSYNALYNGESLFCLRYVSRMFLGWLVVLGVFKYYQYFCKRW